MEGKRNDGATFIDMDQRFRWFYWDDVVGLEEVPSVQVEEREMMGPDGTS